MSVRRSAAFVWCGPGRVGSGLRRRWYCRAALPYRHIDVQTRRAPTQAPFVVYSVGGGARETLPETPENALRYPTRCLKSEVRATV